MVHSTSLHCTSLHCTALHCSCPLPSIALATKTCLSLLFQPSPEIICRVNIVHWIQTAHNSAHFTLQLCIVYSQQYIVHCTEYTVYSVVQCESWRARQRRHSISGGKHRRATTHYTGEPLHTRATHQTSTPARSESWEHFITLQ